MEDYGGNSKKAKATPQEETAERPKVEKVVSGGVKVKKKGLGAKFKEVFVGEDSRSVVEYVVSDVLLPAARNAIVDATSKGIERMMYGDRAPVRRSRGHIPTTGRVQYNRASDPRDRERGRSTAQYRPGNLDRRSKDYILTSREEAEMVLEHMYTILSQYEIVQVADFKDLLGLHTDHTDYKWGWTYLSGVTIQQVREGFILDLPPEEAIG